MMMLWSHLSFAQQQITVTLNPGWSWIAYYLPFEQTLTEALGTFTPEEGDIIKSQGGYSTYHDGQWYGSLSSLHPGVGYMYYSQRTSAVTISFNGTTPTGAVVTVTTSAASQITEVSAVCGGEVLCDNMGALVYFRGICWGTSPNPDFNSNYVEVEGGLGTFSVILDSLTPSTRYYYKAFAVAQEGVYFGEEKTFRTKTPPPTHPTGSINGLFSVSATQQVYFSKGNLQYRASTNTWRFAEHQYDCCGSNNQSVSSTYSGWIDLFGWGTSGYNHGAVCYQPWSGGVNANNYFAYGSATCNLTKQGRPIGDIILSQTEGIRRIYGVH